MFGIIFVTLTEQHSITLLYATKEEKFINAVALKEFLEEKIQK
jgi:uncharacterized protein YeaO (DUF488 family)